MNKTTLTMLLLFVILLPAQAVLFNNLILFNVALPIVFIYLIITLPVTMGETALYTVAFLTGLAMDILSDTPGVNALSCTLLAALRRPVFHLYVPSDNDLADQRPLPRTMGTPAFLKYSGTMVVIYCTLYFTIDSLHIFNVELWLLRIVSSSVFSFALIYATACLTTPLREKRL